MPLSFLCLINPCSPLSTHFRMPVPPSGTMASLIPFWRVIWWFTEVSCQIIHVWIPALLFASWVNKFTSDSPVLCKQEFHSQKCEKVNNIINMKCLEPQIWHIIKGLPAWGTSLPFPGGPVAETALPMQGVQVWSPVGGRGPTCPAKDPVQPNKWILLLLSHYAVCDCSPPGGRQAPLSSAVSWSLLKFTSPFLFDKDWWGRGLSFTMLLLRAYTCEALSLVLETEQRTEQATPCFCFYVT